MNRSKRLFNMFLRLCKRRAVQNLYASSLSPDSRLSIVLEFLLPADHERLQRAPDHRPGRLRRSVRLQEGRHGKDVSALPPGGRGGKGTAVPRLPMCKPPPACLYCQVRHEVFGQEEDQDEAGGDAGAQRADHAVAGQHRGEFKRGWEFLVSAVFFFYAFSREQKNFRTPLNFCPIMIDFIFVCVSQKFWKWSRRCGCAANGRRLA